MYRHIYGPIMSRRLGVSLGIDMVPPKVCSLDCVYCEVGKTTCLTLERKEYIPVAEIIDELRDYMSRNAPPDFLTFSGSGEPTLHSKLGEIIRIMKKEYPQVKVAVITNATLLYDPDVRKELMECNVALPSLDGAIWKSFSDVDRPVNGLELNRVIDGIAQFSQEFHSTGKDKQVWVEVFIIEGVNSGQEDIDALANVFERIRPDRIQLNTLDRPGTERWVLPASAVTMESIRDQLADRIPSCLVEIISKQKIRESFTAYRSDIENAILETISRRPCTFDDLADALTLKKHLLHQYLEIMQNEGKIQTEIGPRGVFFKSKQSSEKI